MSRLIIAEKPSLAEKIVQALGKGKRIDKYAVATSSGDIVIPLVGHLYELADPDYYLGGGGSARKKEKRRWSLEDLPIVPKAWKIIPKREHKERIEAIAKHLKNVSEVVNAGDPDREGQRLVDELLEDIGYRGRVLRVWLKDLTETGIRKAFSALEDNGRYRNLSLSALARSHADWLIGMNATRAMTVVGGQLLSIGRVQTPTLALVVERELAIENFKPKDYFELYADLQTQDGKKWRARCQFDEAIKDDDGLVTDRKKVEAIASKIEGKSAPVADVTEQEKSDPAPLPFSLSALQKHMSRYGMGAQEVLGIVQKLYDEGILTYPRTDCEYLESARWEEAPKVIASLASAPSALASLCSIAQQADAKIRSRAFDDKKVTAHTAIIPTGEGVEKVANFGDKAVKVFSEVAKRYLAQFYPPYRYLETRIVWTCEDETFVASGRVPIAQGWRQVYRGAEEPEPEEKENEVTALPKVTKGEMASATALTVESKKTQPPKRFTEGTLIEAMKNIHRFVTNPQIKAKLKETQGIGTEATRSAIIETLKKRNYIKVQGKKKEIVPTEVGRAFYASVPPKIRDYGLTGLWEQALSEIESGSMTVEAFEEKQVRFVHSLIADIVEKGKEMSESMQEATQTVIGTCPKCGADVIETKKSYGCSRWKEGCDFKIWKEIAQRAISAAEAKALLEHKKTKKLSGFVSKAGKKFDAVLTLDDSGNVAFAFEDKGGEAKEPGKTICQCAKCGHDVQENGKAYRCSGCGLTVWKTIASRPIREEEAIALFTKGYTDLLHGFVSKAKKKFSASLKIENDKVQFEFKD